jgi:hypothetical protein
MTPDRTLDGSAPPAPPAPPATPRPFHPLVAVGLGLVVGIVIARLARR